MAAVSLFWDTNMAVVTSSENTLYVEKYLTTIFECIEYHIFIYGELKQN